MTSKPPAPDSPQGAAPGHSHDDAASGTQASFEGAIKRLTEIVERLEDGDSTLEDSLRLFEEGVKLSRISQERLDKAQKKVEELLRVDDQGGTRTQPFQTADDENDPR